MTGGADEIEAGVHTEVRLLVSLRLLLLSHVHFVLVVNEFDDGCPRVSVIDIISEARCVDDGELALELLLLELCFNDVDLHCLVELLCMSTTVVFASGELGGEKGVDD